MGGKDGKRKTTKMLKKQPEAQGRPGETRAGNRTENRISLVLNVLKSRKT